ncbi:hypothetical protein [Pueribacillus sp. YX66]|uniref:hypothetical protein n=1 Tax=Pueribacillus sp. YX66 TaxID=3229242 RepID=UPI00358CDF0E
MIIIKIKINFFNNDLIKAIGSGVYEIVISKDGDSKVLYVGESVFVLVRCASHLYELKKSPEYFGFTNKTICDESITLEFRLIGNEKSKKDRKIKELDYIKKNSPLIQSGISDRMKKIEDKIESLTDFLNDKVGN